MLSSRFRSYLRSEKARRELESSKGPDWDRRGGERVSERLSAQVQPYAEHRAMRIHEDRGLPKTRCEQPDSSCCSRSGGAASRGGGGAAIGAAPIRLMRQVLVECAVMALSGGAAGLLLTVWTAVGIRHRAIATGLTSSGSINYL